MKKLENLGVKLTQDEQKRILGEVGCYSNACYVIVNEEYDMGYCGWVEIGGGYGICECDLGIGGYPIPNGGTSSCYY